MSHSGSHLSVESVQVVKFFGIVSLPVYQICLSVLMALEEENSDTVYSMDINNTLVLKASAMRVFPDLFRCLIDVNTKANTSNGSVTG